MICRFPRARTHRGRFDGIPADRIHLVQLSDLDHGVDLKNVVETDRHHRLLPGKGHFPIANIVTRLKQLGYAGPIGLEVFNDALMHI